MDAVRNDMHLDIHELIDEYMEMLEWNRRFRQGAGSSWVQQPSGVYIYKLKFLFAHGNPPPADTEPSPIRGPTYFDLFFRIHSSLRFLFKSFCFVRAHPSANANSGSAMVG